MIWARMLAYIIGNRRPGTSTEERISGRRENRILRAQIKGRLLLSDAEKGVLAEIAHRLGRKALEELSAFAKPTQGVFDRTGLGSTSQNRVLTPSPTSPTISLGAFTLAFHLSCLRSLST